MLTDTKVRNAKPRDKGYKIADSGGLHLFVSPAGGKLWRYRYEFGGKEKLLSLGPYPENTLLDARVSRDAARAILREGRDPAIAKKQNRLIVAKQVKETFATVGREWFAANRKRWSAVHAQDVKRQLERDVYPVIGEYPVRDLKPQDILHTLKAIEERGAVETAHRARQRISAIFAFAMASDKADTNPAIIVAGALSAIVKGRQPAITDLAKARQILVDVDTTPGHIVTKLAIRLLALTAVRPGVIAGAPWAELSPGQTVWTVPAQRMKLRLGMKNDERRDHLVPLSRQAVEVIECIRTITGDGPMAFPNHRHAHKPMSENAMAYMLNRAGYHHRHVPHGWRATFSTIMNERFPNDRAIIDLMLAHVPKDEVESAYNRAAYLPRRVELAQLWADLIADGLKSPATLKDMPFR
jgi:integrase